MNLPLSKISIPNKVMCYINQTKRSLYKIIHDHTHIAHEFHTLYLKMSSLLSSFQKNN